MSLTPPTDPIVDWANAATGLDVDPPGAAKINAGWTVNERPPSGWWNYVWRNTARWLSFLYSVAALFYLRARNQHADVFFLQPIPNPLIRKLFDRVNDCDTVTANAGVATNGVLESLIIVGNDVVTSQAWIYVCGSASGGGYVGGGSNHYGVQIAASDIEFDLVVGHKVNTALVAVGGGAVYKVTWSGSIPPVVAAATALPGATFFRWHSDRAGVVIATDQTGVASPIARTSNDATSWTLPASPQTTKEHGHPFYDALGSTWAIPVLFAGGVGYVYSTDAGLTWINGSFALANRTVRKVTRSQAVGSPYVIYATTNTGGAEIYTAPTIAGTWTLKDSVTNGTDEPLHFANFQHVAFLVRGTVMESFDAGVTWEQSDSVGYPDIYSVNNCVLIGESGSGAVSRRIAVPYAWDDNSTITGITPVGDVLVSGVIETAPLG